MPGKNQSNAVSWGPSPSPSPLVDCGQGMGGSLDKPSVFKYIAMGDLIKCRRSLVSYGRDFAIADSFCCRSQVSRKEIFC